MQMFDLNETIDQLVEASSVRWYGDALRKDKNNFMSGALDLNVHVNVTDNERSRPWKTWLNRVETLGCM